ncbi:MAG: S41 family peptidase [Thermacetogeniaceae bacterium]
MLSRKLAATLLVLVLILAGVSGFFVWADRNHVDDLVKTYFLIKAKSLNRVSTAALVEGAIRGMVDALNDPYSVYLDRAAFQELNLQIEGAFGGIGVEIDLNENKELVVVAPLPGTPAERAGIKSGDIITEINGRETAQMSLIEAASLLRGTPGTKVTLKIWRPAENRYFPLTLRRERIQVPSVKGKVLTDHPEIGYIQIMQFNQMSTIPQLNRELSSIEKAGCRGLILDLRDNPGGDLQTAVEVASYFVKHGPVVRIVHRGGAEDVLQPVFSRRVKVPLVVLVNGGSASASEIVAGAIKDTGSGILVGERTFGKGLVQTVFNLDRDTGVKLTTDKYLTPNGHDINKKGIEPDVVVKQDAGGRKDAQLEKGIQILEEQIRKAAERAA